MRGKLGGCQTYHARAEIKNMLALDRVEKSGGQANLPHRNAMPVR